MAKPRIFHILSFRPLGDGTRVTHSHMVAAFTSAEAEAEFLAADHGEVFDDADLYISTDGVRDLDPHSNVAFYVSGASDTPRRDRPTEQTYRLWVQAVTRDEWHDGEFSPATYRKIEREAVTA